MHFEDYISHRPGMAAAIRRARRAGIANSTIVATITSAQDLAIASQHTVAGFYEMHLDLVAEALEKMARQPVTA